MSQRPGFQRNDTDIAQTHVGSSTSSAEVELNDMDKGGSKKGDAYIKEREVSSGGSPPAYDEEDSTRGEVEVVTEAKDIQTQVIHVEDDATVSPWTFRMFFLGVGFSIFGSVLQEIFYFKPQVIFVSVIFLTVLAYVLGQAMATFIPRKGKLGRFLNPGPFNMKEHAAITLMASAASQSALSTEALAVQQLYYGGYPSHAAGIFITMSSQLIGYGIAGVLREVLIRPTKMLWPSNIPIVSLLETLHYDKESVHSKLKVFYIVFGCIFVWQIFPEYVFTVLEGVSIFCLAKQDSLTFSNLFGGASGNEGLGFLSICFDWNYIAGLGSPLWVPLTTLSNSLIGYLGCIIIFMAVYYGNIWRSQDFPFLSQLLFDGSSNSTQWYQYDSSKIINSAFEIDQAAFEAKGTPYLTGTYVAALITLNMALTATLVHIYLWNYEDIKAAWSWCNLAYIKQHVKLDTLMFWKHQPMTTEQLVAKYENDPRMDPHYQLMTRKGYKEIPQAWYGLLFIVSFIVGLVCLYVMKSTLPWWGFIIANLLTLIFTLFFGAQAGITGFQFNLQSCCQMLAGYLFPGRPLANLYFTCYTYNSFTQALVLSKDLKLAQYVHLSHRATYTVQVVGCVVGALFNYVIMLTVVKAQGEILTSVDGTNIWSGQNIQQFNTLAVAWSVAKDMFSVGARYQWVTIAFVVGFGVPIPFYLMYRFAPGKLRGWRPLMLLNTPIILWYMGWLFVGINASILSYFVLGFFAQFYLRKYKPQLFIKYNYLLSAALDGGTQVLVFIFTFAVFGGSGTAHPFPIWAGNPDTSIHNLDYCMVDPRLSTVQSI